METTICSHNKAIKIRKGARLPTQLQDCDTQVSVCSRDMSRGHLVVAVVMVHLRLFKV